MWEAWNDVFRRTLGPADRGLVSELRWLWAVNSRMEVAGTGRVSFSAVGRKTYNPIVYADAKNSLAPHVRAMLHAMQNRNRAAALEHGRAAMAVK